MQTLKSNYNSTKFYWSSFITKQRNDITSTIVFMCHFLTLVCEFFRWNISFIAIEITPRFNYGWVPPRGMVKLLPFHFRSAPPQMKNRAKNRTQLVCSKKEGHCQDVSNSRILPSSSAPSPTSRSSPPPPKDLISEGFRT